MRVEIVDLDDLPTDLSEVHAYWRDLRGDRFAPVWREIDMMRFPSRLLPMTMVVDVAEPLTESVFRYWGSGLTEIHGRDMTGKHPYDLMPPTLGRQILLEHAEVIRTRVANASHFSFLTEQGFAHSHTLVRLPISNDGTTVSQIVIVIDYSREALRRIRESGKHFGDIFSDPDDG